MMFGKIDKGFLIISAILAVAGFFIFSSASLGILASNEIKFSNVAFNQMFYGLFLGSLACLVFYKIDYRILQKNAFLILLFSIVLTALVFAPGIGVAHGGARRWLDFGFISFQPAELLKIGFVIYLSAWFAKVKDKIKTPSHGLAPLLALLGITGVVLLAQPDTDTYAVIFLAGLAIFISAKGKLSHLLTVGLLALVGLAAVVYARPYVKERFITFLDPASNIHTSSYQIRQSLIAIGSGGIWGRGFGKSIQKFSYLPEPIGDSIFAVAAEEFGFIGTSVLILLFIVFAFKGFRIASRSKDIFGGLLVVGIITLITTQMFINIGGMTGLIPLTGIPLPFVSHGGTALFITLVEVGIILNISKQSKKV